MGCPGLHCPGCGGGTEVLVPLALLAAGIYEVHQHAQTVDSFVEGVLACVLVALVAMLVIMIAGFVIMMRRERRPVERYVPWMAAAIAAETARAVAPPQAPMPEAGNHLHIHVPAGITSDAAYALLHAPADLSPDAVYAMLNRKAAR
jgi:hypothetical protein